MTLQSSGAISLSDLRGEFGGAAPDAISEYYRGGALVPDTAGNAGIPTSGAISLSDFYGTSALTVTLDRYDGTGLNLSRGPCSAGVKVRRNGNVEKGSSNTSTTVPYSDVGGTPNEWADPESATVGDGFHVRFLTNTGALTVGTANTWLAITSDRVAEVNADGGGSMDDTVEWNGKVQISGDGGSTIDAETVNFTLQASSTVI